MIATVVYLLAVVATLVGSPPVPGVAPTEKFNKSKVLDRDNKYTLFWKYNATHITFETHVKTTGYVGFGISHNGNMYPADVVIGWVKDNVTHFADRHTTARAAPIRDQSQDWVLLHGEERNNSGTILTILKFIRRLDTCDSTDDIAIKEGALHLIYSYNDKDPANDSALFYHGPANRGTKSVSLLSEFEQLTDMPADVRHIEFLNRNFIIPNASTTYNCFGFQLPDLGGKHHMIQYEPVITPGNELNIHHILLYRCKGINSSYDGVQGNCYERDRPLPQCFNLVVAWVIGGQPFYFPSNVGYSVGDPNDASFYIMETHYDNPKLEAGKIDSSGIRISITMSLRTHDAGILLMGHDITLEPIIPPYQKDFLVKGYCPVGCINKGLSDSHLSDIKIFAALQHSHLLGRSIKTRHFRNGTELEPIMYDPHYDFNFQELIMLQQERVVKPGDSFSVECKYDSTGKTKGILSGWGTDEEMCNTFFYYYPWMDTSFCLSRSKYDSIPVHGKQQVFSYLRSLDWTDPAVVAQAQLELQNSTVEHQCMGAELNSFTQFDFVERETAYPYQAPAKPCDAPVNPVIIG